MWCIGVLDACRVMIRKGSLTIGKIHGYSFGSLAALAFICDIPTSVVLSFYTSLCTRGGNRCSEICSLMTKMLEEDLPTDAYIRCRNTVYIGYTVPFPCMEYRERTWFSSNRDLIQYVVYSMTIPGVTTPIRIPTCIARSEYIDGYIGNVLWGWCKQDPSSVPCDNGERISRILAADPHDDTAIGGVSNGVSSTSSEDTCGTTSPPLSDEQHITTTITTSIPLVCRPVVVPKQDHLQIELFPPWFCYRFILHASDPHINLLIIRGCIDMLRFLLHGVDTGHIKRRPSTLTII
jgi:hypothetical protein